MEQLIKSRAQEVARGVIERQRKKGVPDALKALFEFKKKKDAERYGKGLTVKHSELASLITNCDQIGFRHERQHFQVVPEDLKPTSVEKEAFHNNGVGEFKSDAAKKFVKKLMNTFKKRKNISAHLFEKSNEWHLIWFTHDDISAGSKGEAPHWEFGDHVHYTSYLWGLDKSKVWSQFKAGKYSINGLHLKYQGEKDQE